MIQKYWQMCYTGKVTETRNSDTNRIESECNTTYKIRAKLEEIW